MPKKRIYRFALWFMGILTGIVMLISGGLYIFKDDICGIVIDEMNQHLKAKVRVAEVDLSFWGSFPNLSVDFDEVFIQDSYEGSTELDTLLYSKKLRLKFNPMDIWDENYTVKAVEIHPGVLKMKINEDGLINYDVFQPNDDTTSNASFEFKLEKVEFDHFRYSFINSRTNQVYKTLIKEMTLEGELSATQFSTHAKSNIQVLAARSGNVTLLSNQSASLDIVVNVNKNNGSVEFPKSEVLIANLPFYFQGNIQNGAFDFRLNGKNIQIEDAANSLAMRQTEEIKKFSGQGIMLFDLRFKGDANSALPVAINCEFGINGGVLKDPTTGVSISKLKLDGFYSNNGGPTKEELRLSNISFSTKGGPFIGDLKLTNFNNPRFEGNADGLIDLAVLNSLFKIPRVDAIDGTIDLHSDFIVQGKDEGKTNLTYNIDRCTGWVKLNGINAKLIDDKRVFQSVHGKVYLRNNEAGIENITLGIGKSDFKVNGVFNHLVDYFSGTGNLLCNVEVESEKINLHDLGSDSKEEKIRNERAYILPNTISGTVYLKVGSMIYDTHEFANILGNMSMNGRTIHFPRISVQNGGAKVTGSLTIEERTPEIFKISSQLVSDNIDFRSLFKEWDNFKQDVIQSSNIEGVAKANVSFEAPFDLRSGIISKAIVAQVSIQIDDGRLKNVESFQSIINSVKSSSIKNVIGKENINQFGAKLKDLKFDQLKNTLMIRNGVMTLPSMTIKSSALDINVAGTHTFDNIIDYRFGFNLRDLKRKEESEFGEVVDDGTGLNIFMRMYGSLADPKIEWDKATRKEKSQQNREEEKSTVKSMLKSEFGMFGKDSTVQQFDANDKLQDELIIQFDPVKDIDTIMEVKSPQKDTKINRLLNKWKKQSEEEKKEEFEIGE